jgi:hypothetical protein
MTLAGALGAALTAGAGGQAPGGGGIDAVRWMIGCWASTAPGDDTQEYWFAAGADAIVGINRSVRGGRLASYEMMVIRATAEGLSFTAKPSGQPEATFNAAAAAGDEVVFSNPAHDFPQRVLYRFRNGKLQARVEGIERGQTRGFDFEFQRVDCP